MIFRSHSKNSTGSSSPRPPAPTPTDDTIIQNESDVINNNNDGNALTSQT